MKVHRDLGDRRGSDAGQRRWGEPQAGARAQALAAVRGCNYVPSTAVNPIEMWQADTFDQATIERELQLAAHIGLNSVRVFLAFQVFSVDPAGAMKRLDWLVGVADRSGLSVMPVLLDDVNFAGVDPGPGRQPRPRPGIHNSCWVPSVASALLDDAGTTGRIGRYVSDVVGAFAADRRIVAWDVYNEPGNSGVGRRSVPIVEVAFERARAARPVQPLTAGEWDGMEKDRVGWLHSLSDVPSFHAYEAPGTAAFEARLGRALATGRPALCTEWLHRGHGSTIATVLPVFRKHRVGWYLWGLVAGCTQTWLPWEGGRADPALGLWQHDLLHPDGIPWDREECRLITEAAGGTVDVRGARRP